MSTLDTVSSFLLVPILFILLHVKLSSAKIFKISMVSLLFVLFLRLFFYDYADFPITKMIYLFMALMALQKLFEWDALLRLMGVIPDDKNNND